VLNEVTLIAIDEAGNTVEQELVILYDLLPPASPYIYIID
jgi:hypothetical protein